MMMRTAIQVLTAILTGTILASCAEPIEQGPAMGYYLEAPSAYRLVEVLSGKSDRQRQDIVAKALEIAGIPYRAEPFATAAGSGTNLVAEYGRGAAVLVIVAHYDRHPQSPGANDNATCVAAAIKAYGLLLDADPPLNITTRFLFSDDEEAGLAGARAHLAGLGGQGIAGVASFEMCGIGDSFGIWDVYGRAENSLVVRALVQAGAELDFYSAIHGAVPRFGSDHQVFADAGIAAVGVTLLPRGDEKRLREYVDNPNALKWFFRFNRPTIFQAYHTADDKPSTIDPVALDITARIIARLARIFDRLVGQGQGKEWGKGVS